MTRKESPPGAPAPRGLFCPQKPPLTEGKVSTGVRVMSYFGGNSLSQNLTVLPAPSMRAVSYTHLTLPTILRV